MTAMSKVLIVDDNKQTAEAMAQMVEMLDWESRVVLSSRTAMEAIIQHQPRLVLLDLNMPGLNGAEVLGYIKREPTLTNTSVVFVSAEDDPRVQESLREAGAMDYLVKPLSFDKLEAVLEKLETKD